jgi:hypothetical protein
MEKAMSGAKINFWANIIAGAIGAAATIAVGYLTGVIPHH